MSRVATKVQQAQVVLSVTEALQRVAASPLCDPMTAAMITTYLRSGDGAEHGPELVDLAKMRAHDFYDSFRLSDDDIHRMRYIGLASAMFALYDALDGRISQANGMALSAARRLAKAERVAAA